MSLKPGVHDIELQIPQSEVNRKRWKYLGYDRCCSFISSDDDFFILRRFSTLAARVLLALQDELSELESQLQELDRSLASKNALDIHNGSFRQETSAVRLRLIRSIQGKLKEYNELAIQHSELRSRPPVAQKDISSVSNWFYNHKNAILAAETKYIEKHEDLFAVVPRSKTPLRKFLEHSSHFRLLRVWRKTAAIEENDLHDENIHYMSDYRINMFISLIITVAGLSMLIVPLWLLTFVSRTTSRLTIITLFVIVFLCFVSFITAARSIDTLGATAAYAAVLVVFLQVSQT